MCRARMSSCAQKMCGGFHQSCAKKKCGTRMCSGAVIIRNSFSNYPYLFCALLLPTITVTKKIAANSLSYQFKCGLPVTALTFSFCVSNSRNQMNYKSPSYPQTLTQMISNLILLLSLYSVLVRSCITDMILLNQV